MGSKVEFIWSDESTPIPDGCPISDVCVRTGLAWEAHLVPVFAQVSTKIFVVKNHRVMVREPGAIYLGYTKKFIKVLKNADVIPSMIMYFTRATLGKGIKPVRAGMVEHGRWVWVMGYIGKFSLGTGTDVVEAYLVMSHPHAKTGKHFKNMRVVLARDHTKVCFSIPLCTPANRNMIFVGTDDWAPRQTMLADEFLAEARQLVLLAENQFAKMANRMVADVEVEQFFVSSVEIWCGRSRGRKLNKQPTSRIMELHRRLQRDELTSAKGTWWGVMVTYLFYVEHFGTGNQTTKVRRVWYGDVVGKKRRFSEAIINEINRKEQHEEEQQSKRRAGGDIAAGGENPNEGVAATTPTAAGGDTIGAGDAVHGTAEVAGAGGGDALERVDNTGLGVSGAAGGGVPVS